MIGVVEFTELSPENQERALAMFCDHDQIHDYLYELDVDGKVLCRRKQHSAPRVENSTAKVEPPYSISERILAALQRYRCMHYQDCENGGAMLIDLLSPFNTVKEGREELVMLADHVAAELEYPQRERAAGSAM